MNSRPMMHMRYILVALIALIAVSGCSNIKPYQALGSTNLVINAKSDEGIKTEVDVYLVNRGCTLDYQGTLTPDNNTLDTRLQQGEINYLVVRFSSSSFFTGSHSMSQEILFRPDKRNRYHLNLSYIDSIYDINLKQISSKSRQAKPAPQLDWNSCK